jgi:hypothetical protein
MPAEKIIRAIDVEARIVSEAEGLVDYVASDATLDCYREIVDPKGWKFTHFASNAPFVDSHDYWTIEKLLGKVVSFQVTGGQLIERVKWAKDVEENKLAALGWKMTVGGFLKAVSVGFYAKKYASVWGDANAWAAACAALKLDAETVAQCRVIYLEQEQIELSACILGANPNALAKAHKAGCVKDADLAAVGFGDDDMHFLSLAGRALEKSEGTETGELLQLLAGREMGRIAGRNKTISGKPGDDDAGSDARRRAAAEEAERRAVQQREFLKQLAALCEG